MTQNSFYLVDNLTVMRGRHTMKMGVEVRQYHELKYQTWGGGANIGFLGWPHRVRRYRQWHSGYAARARRQFQPEQYTDSECLLSGTRSLFPGQHQVEPALTVMFGARWEPHFGIHSATGDFVTFPARTSLHRVPHRTRWPGSRGRSGRALQPVRCALGQYRTPRLLCVGCFRKRPGLTSRRIRTDKRLSGSDRLQWLYQHRAVRRQLQHADRSSLAKPYAPTYGSTIPFPYTAPAPGDPGNSSLVFPNPVNTIAMSPDYNAEKFISSTLHSISNQSRATFSR